MDIHVPSDVRNYIREVFKACNDRISNKISINPNTWEGSLDMTFIETLSNYTTPVTFSSGWTVRLDTHFLGGMRHWNNWEIADIGVLLFFQRNGEIIKSKTLLLQSKRLYANESELDEESAIHYELGLSRLYLKPPPKLLQPRLFSFGEQSKYKALILDDDQCKAIKEFEQHRQIPVYYLFYNPTILPYQIQVPLAISHTHTLNDVGCRIVPASELYHHLTKEKTKTASPTYGELKYLLNSPFNEDGNAGGWRLEYFISDLFITCQQGYIMKNTSDELDDNVEYLFNRRSGPISAAFSLTFEMKE